MDLKGNTEKISMKSKIDSWCHSCRNKINKGDEIIWLPKGKRAIHKECPDLKTKGVRNSATAFGRARMVTGR